MIIDNGDGTYTAGPLDVWCVLRDMTTGRFHAAFFEEKPMPGPVPEVKDVTVVRLKSKLHHTEGAPDLAGALDHLDEMVAKIQVPEENVWREPREWDGQQGIVWLERNWKPHAHAS